MSLDLGTLTGYLEMDDRGLDGTLSGLPDKLRGSELVAGLAAGAIGLAIGAAIVGGVNRSLDLEDAQQRITAQLALTEEESARIGGVAGALYADAYGESVGEVNDAVQDVVSSIDGMRSATSTALEAMTAKALNFASAFEIDTARSTQVVGQLIKTGLVKDANEGFDLLTRAMQKVPAGVREDILDAADEYGPFFKGIGLDGTKAFDLLVRSADKGMYGIDKAGDAVKEFTIRSTDMSTASTEAYKAIGLDAEDMANRILAGGETSAEGFQMVIDGLLGIESPQERANTAIKLFGTPLEDLSTGEIPAFLESLSDLGDGLGTVEGAAQKMGDTLNDTTRVRWEEVSRSWDSIVGQLGTSLLPALEEVIGFLAENPKVLEDTAALVLGIAGAFVVLKGAQGIAGVALGLGGIVDQFKAIQTEGPKAKDAASGALVGIVAALPSALDGEVSGQDFVTGIANGIVLGAMVGGPWGAAFGALGGLFTSTIVDVFDEGYGAANHGWEQIIGIVPGAPQALYTWLGSVDGSLAGWWEATQGKFTHGWEQITGQAPGAPQEFYRWLGSIDSALDQFWASIPAAMSNGYNQIVGFFSGAGQWLYNSGRDVVQGLLSGLGSMLPRVGGFFLNMLPDWIVGPFKAALGIHSPSTVFAGYAHNIVDGLIGGFDDDQSALDARVSGLVGSMDGAEGSRVASAMLGAQAGAQRNTQVSMAGARLKLTVGDREFDAYISEHVGAVSQQRRTEVVNGAGEVVFA